ncbi:MAG TPA: hypothetical protein VGS20_09815 [Candidatus Acidoferrales bacterium]|nr:hypothetical protein [Candidatus Acidoferrales bacterium]
MARFAFAVLTVLLLAPGAPGQQTGPITPTAPPVIKHIPLHPEVPPPPLPPAEIVRRFTANEAKYRDAYKRYGFQQSVRVEEFAGEQGGPTGTFEMKGEVYLKPTGDQYERILGQSVSTLQHLHLTLPDLEVLANMPLFPLAGDVSADYNFIYRGTEKVDELNTYDFLVQPKNTQPGRSYFSGVVWVDNEDLAIVKSYGQFVTTEPRPADALPFVFFETYRENTEGKYWFPSYIRSDDVIRENGAELPVRLIIRTTEFHLAQPSSAPAVGPPKAGNGRNSRSAA